MGEYDLITYDGAVLDADQSRIGYPALPVLSYHFLLPPETKVDDLTVSVRSREDLLGTYWPIPIQPREGGFEPPDPEIYQSYDPYPAVPFRVVVDGHMKGYHLVTVQAWPLQFIGAQGKLRVITDVDIELAPRLLNAEESEHIFRRYREDHRPWNVRPEVRWLRNHVLNPEALSTFYRYGGSGSQGSGLSTLTVQEKRPFGGFVPTEFPSLEGPPVRMVIITDDRRIDGEAVPGMTTVFRDWAQWKTAKGIPAVVKTVTWIDSSYTGIDRPEKIRNFVKDAAAYWGTDFVLLGGDVDIVPPRYAGGPTSTQGTLLWGVDPPADAYYAELDESWNDDANAFFCENRTAEMGGNDVDIKEPTDLWIGRLPVRDSLEAVQVTTKIASYERKPGVPTVGVADASYYREVLIAGAIINSFCKSSFEWPQGCEYGSGEWYFLTGIPRYVEFSDSIAGSDCNPNVVEMYPDAPTNEVWCEYEEGSVQCFDEYLDVLDGAPDVPLLADSLEARLEKGTAHLWHLGHSEINKLGLLDKETVASFLGCEEDCVDGYGCPHGGWASTCRQHFDDYMSGWEEDLTKERVDDLTNGPLYSIVTSGGCDVARFDQDCVGEHFVRNPNGGAVAFVGATTSGGMPQYEFYYTLFYDEITEVGAALSFAWATAVDPYFGYPIPVRHAVNSCLLGDPEMPVWLAPPESLTVTPSPTSFTSFGAQTVTVDVSDANTSEDLEGARVCLKQRDAAYAVAWTGDDGVARFPSFAVLDTGAVVVVVTAPGYSPRQDTIAVNVAVSPTTWPTRVTIGMTRAGATATIAWRSERPSTWRLSSRTSAAPRWEVSRAPGPISGPPRRWFLTWI